MNKLVIPPSPNWYETDIMACAPDNTLIYGSRQDLIVIKTTPENEPDDVQVITRAHSMRIKSVNINRNWGQPHKYAAIVSEDKIVKVWDIESLEKKFSHNKHIIQDDDTKVVGASFAGDDRVISTSESGTIVIWNIATNETNVLRSLFDSKIAVTCLSVCPHKTWLAAFGLKSGLIAVVDLRRTGRVLYKLRGHDKAVTSLSWCPAPINIFPVKPNNKVVEKYLEVTEEIKQGKEDTVEVVVENKEELLIDDENDKNKASLSAFNKEFSINTKEEREESVNEATKEEKTDRRKQKKPKKAPNPWIGLVHADDESKEPVKTSTSENDFLKDCADLRQQILQMSTPKSEGGVDEASALQESSASTQKKPRRVILKPKTKVQKCTLSDLLLKKEEALQSEVEAIQKDVAENPETVDTPTDRRSISMEISQSVEKLAAKLTDTNEKSMELTLCGGKESTNAVDTSTGDVDGKEVCTDVLASVDNKESLSNASKLDTTTSSEENKQFSSVSSCDNDANCTKKHTEEVVRKSDTSSNSESGDVFHDAQVCEGATGSDSWRVQCANFEEQPRKECLLASSARDKNIYIWRAGTDGRMQFFITVPPLKNHKKGRSEKIWISICWVAPNILLSSSRGADLLQWTLPKPMEQTKFVRQVHDDHWSVLFSIKAPILYLNEHNFLQKRDINAWTTGMDRTILNTDIGSKKNLACYPALGGSVNCLAGSPLDPNRLAIGTGEGVLSVWDLSREHKKRIVFSTFYQKILAAVTALAWHPRVEMTVALATVEGRIGIMDTAGKGKTPKLLPHYFKSQIYKIEWGPLNGDLQTLGLFVVSEAKVAIFNPKSPDKEPQVLEMPDNTTAYTMSWKPDYSFLLVSSKSGSLITYTPDLTISNVTYLQVKLQSIVWNPNALSDDLSVSRYCRTFASLVKYSEFVVYDLGVASDNNDDKVVARFKNRGVNISSIEWNPHSGNQLVSVDDGGVAQVYDIDTKTVLATYVHPGLGALLSAYWSPVDQDYIITGSTAHQVIVWKVSEHAPLTDEEISSFRNRITKAQSREVGDQLVKVKPEVLPDEEGEAFTVKKPTKSTILPLFYGMKEESKVEDMRKLLRWKLGDRSTESNLGDSKYIDVLDVFDGQGTMEKVLNLNIASSRQKGQHHNGNLLALFKGDLDAAVKEAIDQKRVTPWIISMCPMVSPKLWQAACETYANQLQDEPEADPLEIVSYLLACHKVEESIHVLCDRGCFREAFVLAKARVGADSSIVPEILVKWAKNFVFQGNLEAGALCYISMGNYEDAAAVLFRRSSVELLELAVELAKLSGNEELHKAVLFRMKVFETEGDESKGSSKENGEDSSKEVLSGKDGVENICSKEKAEHQEDITEYLQSQEKRLCKLNNVGGAKNEDLRVGIYQNNGIAALKVDEDYNEILKKTELSPKELHDNKEARLVNKKNEEGDRKEAEDQTVDKEDKGLESKSKESIKELDDEVKGGDKLLTEAKSSKKREGDVESSKQLQELSPESSKKRANESCKVAQREALDGEGEDSNKELTDVGSAKHEDLERVGRDQNNANDFNAALKVDNILKKNELSSKELQGNKEARLVNKKDKEGLKEAEDQTLDKEDKALEGESKESIKELDGEVKDVDKLLTEAKSSSKLEGDVESSKQMQELSPESSQKRANESSKVTQREALDDEGEDSNKELKDKVEDSTPELSVSKSPESLKKEATELDGIVPENEEETRLDDKTEDTKDCDVGLAKKVKELLPDLLMEEGNDLDELAQKVVRSQEGLLSTVEVKKLLSKRKASLEGDVRVKEE